MQQQLETKMKSNNRIMSITLPTGSGKTIILLDYIEEYIEENKNTIFVWLTPRKGRLRRTK